MTAASITRGREGIARIHFGFFIVFAALLLLFPKTCKAQNCSTPVANNVGDSITITGTLTTSDPNENGEGEHVVFSSSSGALSGFTISVYFQAQTFTYKATQANETILGVIIGPDGDESCTVSAVVTAQSLKFGILPQADRTALESYSKNLVIVGGGYGTIAALCFDSIISGPICGLPLGSAAAIAVFEGSVLDKLATGGSSDPNFRVIAQPVLLKVPAVTPSSAVTAAEARAYNALFLDEESILAYAEALIASYNRAQGALDAGNAFWEDRQLQAATQYQAVLLSFLASEAGLRTALANLLIADPNFAYFILTPGQAFQGENIIAFGGLPPAISQALLALGADVNTINAIRSLLFVQDINMVAGNFAFQTANPPLLNALKTLLNIFNATLTVQNYQLVGRQTAAAGASYVTYKADLVNPGKAFGSVTATLASLDPYTIRIVPGQGTLDFAPVPANADVTSSNTFTIITNAAVPLDVTKLKWTFQTTPAPVIANAGPNQIVKVGSTVTVAGTQSTNPSGIGTLNYYWRFTSRPPGSDVTLFYETTPTATFVANAPGTYVINLTVSNGVSTDTANITITATR